jgi:ferredoxin
MRVKADHDKCCSSGMCVVWAPDVFTQRESDGMVQVLMDSPPATLRAGVRQAAEACPVRAIEIEE